MCTYIHDNTCSYVASALRIYMNMKYDDFRISTHGILQLALAYVQMNNYIFINELIVANINNIFIVIHKKRFHKPHF